MRDDHTLITDAATEERLRAAASYEAYRKVAHSEMAHLPVNQLGVMLEHLELRDRVDSGLRHERTPLMQARLDVIHELITERSPRMVPSRRTLTDHITNPANAELTIEVQDEPGPGGACHKYAIYGFHSQSNPSADDTCRDETKALILFQNGPIKEAGVNGITQEALLAIVIDRLRGFQEGKFRCRENAIALTKCEEALLWLQKRTRDRVARDVEGTHQQ